MNILKKLVEDWRDAADSKQYQSALRRNAFNQCANELEAMVGAVEALGKFIPGNGVGLPHGTVAWVVYDGRRYIREWHPMDPAPNGTPLGNWWDLEGGRDAMNKRFSEHEVTHYSVIEVPKMPDDKEPSVVPKITAGQKEFDITVGRFHEYGHFFASTTLVNPQSGTCIVITNTEPTEEEAVEGVVARADAVLKTFFSEYKIVRL